MISPWLRYGSVAALAFSSAWGIQALRWNADVAEIQSTHTTTLAERNEADRKAADATLIEQQRLSAERDAANTKYTDLAAQRAKEFEDATKKINQLERDVADGTRRLRIRANCPANTPAAGVPQAGADATGAGAGTAELDPIARQAYFELRRGIERQEYLLNLCRTRLSNQ